MFAIIGQTVSRAWILFLAAWIALLAGTWWAAPPWEEVAQDKEFAFLPPDVPSRQAESVFARAFPDDHLASNIVLVVYRHSGPAQPEQDRKFIEDTIEPGLRAIAAKEGGLASEAAPSEQPLFPTDEPAKPTAETKHSIMARIRTPNAPGTGALLVSPDGRAMLVVVELTTEFLTRTNWPTIKAIQDMIAEMRSYRQIPAGVEIALTGSAVVGRDHSRAQRQSADATEFLTVVLVIALLVLIYRAPLLALIPLATVYLAVKIAINTLAILAKAGHITLFEGIQIYVTILTYGAGVDYCLFLTARYKEELDHGYTPREAIARSIRGVGAALAASAATVAGGIAMMIFAQFGKFHEAGIAIPVSIVLVLIATLTFSPSLLRPAGRWAFWPRHAQPEPAPAAPASPIANGRGWLPWRGSIHRAWHRLGDALLRRPGTIWLGTVACMAPFVMIAGIFYNRLSYDLIGDLPADSTSVQGTRVLQEYFPSGLMGPVTVLLVNSQVDFASAQGHEVARDLTERLTAHRQDLGLADIRSLAAPLGITPASERGVSGLDVPAESREKFIQQAANERYLTDLGERTKIGTRFELILKQSPFAHQSLVDLDHVEALLKSALPTALRQDDTKFYFMGPTASVRDLAKVIKGDRVRIELLVLACVFVILIALLRRLLIPLYLLLSVLFSYYATLGVTFLLFWALDPQGFAGIDWRVAIFLFTILIAVGEDYNIFLMARIDEEERRHGPVRGIVEALTRTGPIISSCGIIMAGTFASLLGGSLGEMKQLGFALAFGVLLDTFVVRPVLVPSFILLLRQHPMIPSRWRRSPSENGSEAHVADRSAHHS